MKNKNPLIISGTIATAKLFHNVVRQSLYKEGWTSHCLVLTKFISVAVTEVKGSENVTEWMEGCYEISLLQLHMYPQSDLSEQ